MANLSKKVRKWCENGLISNQEARAILDFEKDSRPFLNPLMTFIFVGIFSIGCGIVAVVSSNWYVIPAWLKLFNMFALLIASACGTAYVHKKRDALFEVAILMNMMLFFAAIGLIGQVFHLTADSYKAFLFWSVLSFPLLFMTKKVFFGFVWYPVFIGAIMASPVGEDIIKCIIRSLPTAISVSFAGFILYVLLDSVKKARVFVRPLKFLSVGLFLLPLMFGGGNIHYRRALDLSEYVAATYVLYGFGIAFSWLFWRFSKTSEVQKKTVLAVICVYGLSGVVVLMENGFASFLSDLALLFALLIFTYQYHEELLARIVSMFTALRILIAFFELFGSLLATGIGLIFSGMVILGVCYGWFQVNRSIKIWMGTKA